MNERYADYLGLPKDHPLRLGAETGVPWDTHLQLLHPDDHEESRRVGATILRTGSAGQAAFRIRNAQGGYRWFLSRVEPFRGSDGTLLCFIGINLDIEERKQAEQKLKDGEAELRQILGLAPQLVGVLGPQRERIYANQVALEYYGVSLGEWRQRNNVPEVHPDDFDAVKAYIDLSMISGAANEVEARLRGGDGTYRWFLVRSNPLRDGQGQLVRWYIACTDIDDRKRAEESYNRKTSPSEKKSTEPQCLRRLLGLRRPCKVSFRASQRSHLPIPRF